MQVEPRLGLVLLPGMDGTSEMLAPFIAELNGAYPKQVVSYPVDGALGYEQLTEMVQAVLPKEAPYVLLGESFSGPIAIALAAQAPRNLRGLILCATFAANPQPRLAFSRNWLGLLPVKSAPQFVASQLLMGRFFTPLLCGILARSLAKVSSEALRARMAAILKVDVTASLESIRMPILYMRASEDRLVPERASKYLLAHCVQAREVVFAAPHFLLQTQPQMAAACVQEFCTSLLSLAD